jgi:uncharacterized protein (UPF0128 family)
VWRDRIHHESTVGNPFRWWFKEGKQYVLMIVLQDSEEDARLYSNLLIEAGGPRKHRLN